MDFYICAQDIGQLSLGLSDDTHTFIEETFFISPELYLKTMDSFFKKYQVAFHQIKRIVVVPGPGSFTASRVSVTIANTIAFAKRIPVVSVPNPNKYSLQGLFDRLKNETVQESAFALPLYDRPPMITQAKKYAC